jgi:hypothetical protein
MVNNAININKTNNHLPHQTIKQKKTRHLTMEIHVLAWEGNKNVTGLNRSMETQTASSDNWIPNDNTDNIYMSLYIN